MPPAYPWEAPLGAHPTPDGPTRFRVWAPRAGELALDLDGARRPLDPEGHGVFVGDAPAAPGSDYAFVVDGERLPDPNTRWQPEGLRGASRVLDPGGFRWTDGGWRPPALGDLVLY